MSTQTTIAETRPVIVKGIYRYIAIVKEGAWPFKEHYRSRESYETRQEAQAAADAAQAAEQPQEATA